MQPLLQKVPVESISSELSSLLQPENILPVVQTSVQRPILSCEQSIPSYSSYHVHVA